MRAFWPDDEAVGATTEDSAVADTGRVCERETLIAEGDAVVTGSCRGCWGFSDVPILEVDDSRGHCDREDDSPRVLEDGGAEWECEVGAGIELQDGVLYVVGLWAEL